MTGKAQGRLSLGQQIFFIRTVSEVAGPATLGQQYFVHDILFIVRPLMTLVTGFTSSQLEHMI
jgi:hypothetical protein